MFLNLEKVYCFMKKKKTNPPKSSVTKLNPVRPSGKTDESFFELVFDVVRQIPKGRVTSYGAIAAALGTKLSSRMVGWAMNGAHRVHPPVPAHRVVNRLGLLTGKHHFASPTTMQENLEAEGIIVEDDKIVNFKQIFWNPGEENQ
jgi:methylated-DNA-protein-cysteine methyltransferase-like protein